MKIGKLLAVLTLSLILLPAVPVKAAPTVSDIGKELICQCGCLFAISEMGHFLNRTLWPDQAVLASSLRPRL